MENKNNTETQVYKLGALENLEGWEVHPDDTDIRGWEVYTIRNERIGKVENLIADTELKKVRYVEVEVDKDINQFRDHSYRNKLDRTIHDHYGRDDDRHVIIPIGLLKVDEVNQKLIAAPNLTVRHFSSSPRYEGIRRRNLSPIVELLAVRYFADLDEKDREVYNEKKYDFEGYRATPYIKDRGFYDSDLFSRDRYLKRQSRLDNSMAKFKTGGPQ